MGTRRSSGQRSGVIGKELRDPQQTVDGLVAEFQGDIAREETGTGR